MPTDNDDEIRVLPGTLTDGLAGNDVFHWSGGAATITGGADDFDANPYTPGNPGGDRLFIEGDGAFVWLDAWNAGFARLGADALAFSDVERIHGTAGGDTIRAGRASLGADGQGVSLFSGAGDDDINGSTGNDVIDGGSGNDTIRAGSGNDFINSSTGDDLIYGGAGDENIRWGVGDAHWHNPGNDTIYGGEGRDLINVWVKDGDFNGADSVAGGNVTITATRQWGDFTGVATVGTDDHGGAATLRFQGFEQGWTHEGNDTVDGSAARVWGDVGIHWNTRWGSDVLTGTAGNDTLEGGAGSDTLTGGRGDDLVSASEGFYDPRAPGDGDADVIVFNPGDGHDTLLGFDVGVDTIATDMAYAASLTDGGTLLTFESGDSILLSNVFDL